MAKRFDRASPGCRLGDPKRFIRSGRSRWVVQAGREGVLAATRFLFPLIPPAVSCNETRDICLRSWKHLKTNPEKRFLWGVDLFLARLNKTSTVGDEAVRC